MRDETVHYLPTFEEELARRLEALRITCCHLKMIERENLEQFPQLRVLRMFGNDLQSLHAGLFQSTPKLEHLDVESNDLKSVGVNIYNTLNNIREIDFRNAEGIDFIAKSPREIKILKSELLLKCNPEGTMRSEF